MQWAKDNGKSHAWVFRHMAAIAKLAGLVDPTSSFLPRPALKGWARDEPKAVDSRLPIEFGTRKKMLDELVITCTARYEETLFRAAFALAFFGAFRCC